MNRGRLKTDMQNRACWWKGNIDRAPTKPRVSQNVDAFTFRDHVRGCMQERVSEEVINYYKDHKLVGQQSMTRHGVQFLIV